MPNHPLGEELLPNIEPKPPLTQFQAVPLEVVTGHHRSVSAPFLPSEGSCNCNGVSPQSPPLQAEQTIDLS